MSLRPTFSYEILKDFNVLKHPEIIFDREIELI